ncbi:MAG: ImuA protein [Beijerinckiaceae bacterium]
MSEPNRADRVQALRRLLPDAAEPRPGAGVLPLGVPAIDGHLPQAGLMLGALHEIAPADDLDRPAAFGFAAALLGRTAPDRPVLLVLPAEAASDGGRPSGHGLQRLGLDPARLVIVEAKTDKERLWAMQEALRSRAPAAVAGALDRLDLKTSQRLHHAAGDAGLPLFLLRPARSADASAAATRWRVAAAPAARDRFGLIERWRWSLSLERCRNGRTGEWLVEFDYAYRFSLAPALADPAISRRADAPAFANAHRS